MKILQKIVAAICAVAVTATMTSPISIGDNSARGAEVQRVSETNAADSPAALSDEEKPMSGKCGDNLTWVLDDEGTLTISGTGEMYDFNGNSPWSGVKSAVIEHGVTNISPYAFYGYAGMTEITIPNSVTNIGYEAFRDCSSLTSIVIPNSVTSIGEGAFTRCAGLTDVTLGNGLSSISSSAFSGCSGLTEIMLPDSVTSIGEYAFSGCSSLTEVKLPDSVTSIGRYAFSHTPFLDNMTETIKYAGKIVICCNQTATTAEIKSGTVGIADNAFSDCSELTVVTIPNSVTHIGSFAFSNCSNLTEVTIGNGVTSIGAYAFSNCSTLTTVTLPYSMTSIDPYAFSNCSGLRDVKIPNSVTHIGSNAFSDCINLTDITLPNSITHIDDYAFFNCESMENIELPKGISKIESDTFVGCKKLSNITIPEGVAEIGTNAFSGCDSLIYIKIPKTVTNICMGGSYVGIHAFRGCNNLTSIDVDKDNPIYCSIDGVLFSKDRTNLILCPEGKTYYYEIPEGTSSIGHSAFAFCEKLDSVVMPNSLTIIYAYAFYKSGITSIAIPGSVKTIRTVAFECCSNLASLSIANGVENIDEYAFADCSSLKSITLPSSIKNFKAAFVGCSNLSSVRISNGVDCVDDTAFWKCNKLTRVYIPNSVNTIKASAFNGCGALASIVIPNSVKLIEDAAFLNCGVKDVYFTGMEEEWKAIVIEDREYMFDTVNSAITKYAKIHYNSSGPDYAEELQGNVHFLTSYDLETNGVQLDDGFIGLYKLANTVDTTAIPSMAGKYVMADIVNEGGTNFIKELVPVESKLGTISDFDIDNSTITIDEEVYSVPTDESAFAQFASQSIGKRVLAHTSQGKVVGLSSIMTKTANLISWDYTKQELTVGDSKFTADFLTDISFLANFDQIVGKTVKVEYTKTGLHTPIVNVALVAQDKEYPITVGSRGLVTAEIPYDVKSWIWRSSDGNVVSFSYENASDHSSTWSGNSSKTSHSFYGRSEGTATITCETLDGEILYSRVVKVYPKGTTEPTIVNNWYEIEQTYTGTTNFDNEKSKVEAAYQEYINAVKENLNKLPNNAKDFPSIDEQAKTMMAMDADNKNKHKFIDFVPSMGGTIPNDMKTACYKALCETIQEKAEEKGFNLKKIDISDPLKCGKNLTEIYSLMQKIETTKTFNGITVEIDGFSAATSSTSICMAHLTCYKKNGVKIYEGVAMPNVSDPVNMMSDFMCNLVQIEDNALKDAYDALSKELLNVPLSGITKASVNKLANRFQDTLKKHGLEHFAENICSYIDYKDAVNKVGRIIQSGKTPTKADISDIKSKILGSKHDKVTKKVEKKLISAQSKFCKAMEEYYFSVLIPNNKKTAAKINCPVSVSVFKDGTQIGYVGDDDIWYTEDIEIEENGEAKTVYSNPDDNISLVLTGTDTGTMSYVVESYDEAGVPVGRLNFYDIPLEKDKVFNGSLSDVPLETNQEKFALVSNGTTISANEYISVCDNARVDIEVTNSTGGSVGGEGVFVRGDAAVLYAVPDEGYYFAGWYDNSDELISSSSVFEFTSKESCSINAKFECYKNISFDANGGKIGDDDIVVLTSDTNNLLATFPEDPVYDEYKFDGWYSERNGGEKVGKYSVIPTDTTVYAHWTENVTPPVTETGYKITFDANGGTASSAELTTDENGKLNSLPTATHTDYTFDGWFTAVDRGEKITTETIFTEDTTVYAHWTKNVTPPVTETGYKITFDANGGTASSTELTTDENGKLNSLPTATRTGYTFDGWFMDTENGEKITTGTVFTEDTTVYAHWTKNTGDSESSGIPDTSDSSNSGNNGTDSDTSSGSGANVDSGLSADSEVSSGSSSDDTSNNSKPGDSTSGTDSDDLDTNNPSTGVTVAIVPILLAAGASVVIFRKKDRNNIV